MTSPQHNFLETANFLGARLSRDAIWAGKRCNWFGVAATEISAGTLAVAHRVCGSDLYSGTSGIAVFLGHLYAATGERVFRITAEGAIRQALSRLDDFPKGKRVAFFTGLTGIAYALIALARTCNIEKFSSLAIAILEEIRQDDVCEGGVDLIDASVDAIPALLGIYRREQHDFLLQLAIKYGEHLLDVAEETKHGLTWSGNNSSQDTQFGFARGTGGIARILLELYQATGEMKFYEAAEEGFQYERNTFAQRAANAEEGPLIQPRVDTKNATNVSAPSTQDASGFALSRLRAFEILKSSNYFTEAQVAARTIAELVKGSLSEAVSVDFSYAQGLAGQADLLTEASRILETEDPLLTAEEAGRWGIDHYRTHNLPWPCRTQCDSEAPSLMIGLAGIGYFYLRLNDSKKVPSLLMLSQ